MENKYAIVMLTNSPQLLEISLKYSQNYNKYPIEFIFDNRLNMMNEDILLDLCKKYNYNNINITTGEQIFEWFGIECARHDFLSLQTIVDIYFLHKYDKIIRIEDDMIIDDAERFNDLFETEYDVITSHAFWGGRPPQYKQRVMNQFITDIDYLPIFEDTKNRINGGVYVLTKNTLEYYENMQRNWYVYFEDMIMNDKRGFRCNDEIMLTILRTKFNGLNSTKLQYTYSNDRFDKFKPTKQIIRHYMGGNSKRRLLEILEIEDEFKDVIR